MDHIYWDQSLSVGIKEIDKYNYPKYKEHSLEHIKLLNKIELIRDGLLIDNVDEKDTFLNL